MSRVLFLNGKNPKRRNVSPQRVFAYKKGSYCSVRRNDIARKGSFASGRMQISSVSLAFVLIAVIFICGAFYLFQVNSIATRGFEVRELEKKIQELGKENKKMEIQEVELRSMYNIEKASKELNLVDSREVTYIEIKGPVAMK